MSCITAVVVTGDYCAKVCRVLQLCSSLVITVPKGLSCITVVIVTGDYCAKVVVSCITRSIVYYNYDRHW